MTAALRTLGSEWVASSEHDLLGAEQALQSRDLEALGRVMEHSCLKMHAAMMATQPPLLYWNGTTVDGSAAGAGVYFIQVETASGKAGDKVTLLR